MFIRLFVPKNTSLCQKFAEGRKQSFLFCGEDISVRPRGFPPKSDRYKYFRKKTAQEVTNGFF